MFNRKKKQTWATKRTCVRTAMCRMAVKPTYVLKISLYVYKPSAQVKNKIKQIRFKKNGGHRSMHRIQAHEILKVLIKWKWKPRWTSGKKFIRHKVDYFKPIQGIIQYDQYSSSLVCTYRIKTFKVRSTTVLLYGTGN